MSGLFHLILSTNWLPFRCLLERGLLESFALKISDLTAILVSNTKGKLEEV